MDSEPLSLSREVSAVAGSWRRWTRRLRVGEGLEEDPFELGRRVAGKTAFEEVSESPACEPIRLPLRRWVYRLAEQRINRPLIATLAEQWRVQRRPVEVPERGEYTMSEILWRVLSDRERSSGWLEALQSHAGAIGPAMGLLWERRQEIAQRLGLSGPDELELPCQQLYDLAQAWLTTTQAVSEVVQAQTLREWLDAALALDAGDGWPGRLNPRSLLDLLAEGDLLRGIALEPGPLPRALAPASFQRALMQIGAAWVEAAAPSQQPFVVAHDPFGLRRHEYGALFALLSTNPSFLTRRLGLARSQASDHQRVLAVALLCASRLAAVRVLLRRQALQGFSAWRAAFEEAVGVGLAIGLPTQLAGSLIRLELEDGQRFAGWLLAASRGMRLVEAHDEDWFRNPRGSEELRDEANLSPQPTTSAENLTAGSDALATHLQALIR